MLEIFLIHLASTMHMWYCHNFWKKFGHIINLWNYSLRAPFETLPKAYSARRRETGSKVKLQMPDGMAAPRWRAAACIALCMLLAAPAAGLPISASAQVRFLLRLARLPQHTASFA